MKNTVFFDGELLTVKDDIITADSKTIKEWEERGLIKHSFLDSRTGVYFTFTAEHPSIEVQQKTIEKYNIIVNKTIEDKSPFLRFCREEVGIVPLIQIPDSCKKSVDTKISNFLEENTDIEVFHNKKVFAIKDSGEDIIHSKTDIYLSLFYIQKKYSNMSNDSVMKFRKEIIYNELNSDFWSFTK